MNSEPLGARIEVPILGGMQWLAKAVGIGFVIGVLLLSTAHIVLGERFVVGRVVQSAVGLRVMGLIIDMPLRGQVPAVLSHRGYATRSVLLGRWVAARVATDPTLVSAPDGRTVELSGVVVLPLSGLVADLSPWLLQGGVTPSPRMKSAVLAASGVTLLLAGAALLRGLSAVILSLAAGIVAWHVAAVFALSLLSGPLITTVVAGGLAGLVLGSMWFISVRRSGITGEFADRLLVAALFTTAGGTLLSTILNLPPELVTPSGVILAIIWPLRAVVLLAAALIAAALGLPPRGTVVLLAIIVVLRWSGWLPGVWAQMRGRAGRFAQSANRWFNN